MRVLIVEDEKDLAVILSEILEMEGYYTDIVHDGVVVLIMPYRIFMI